MWAWEHLCLEKVWTFLPWIMENQRNTIHNKSKISPVPFLALLIFHFLLNHLFFFLVTNEMAYVKVSRNCKSLCRIITVRGKWGAVKIDFRSHDWRMASWKPLRFLEGLFPKHWANLYSSLNGLVTWCPNLFNFLSTNIKISFHAMISGICYLWNC